MLAASPDDPWLACRLAASVGGDCDTIAAMAGAIGGACHGSVAFPAAARRTVDQVNDLHLDELAAGPARAQVGPLAPAGPGRAGHVTRQFGRLLHLGNVVIDVVLDVPASPSAAATCWPGGTR